MGYTVLRWSEIIFHHSAGPDGYGLDFDSILAWHTNPPPRGRGWADIGYHYIVEKLMDKTRILVGRPETMDGAHCPGHNEAAIGICFVGNFTTEPPWASTLEEAARRLVLPLRSRYGIPRERLYLHREASAKPTDCPGAAFTRDLMLRYFGV